MIKLKKTSVESFQKDGQAGLKKNMDVKVLSDLLRGTIDPTHRNEAEKKLTEVTILCLKWNYF